MIIEIYVSDADAQRLAHDITNVGEWLNGALRGKIAACEDRMIKEWLPRLLKSEDVATIPATDEGLLEMILAQPDYMNRIQRDLIL